MNSIQEENLNQTQNQNQNQNLNQTQNQNQFENKNLNQNSLIKYSKKELLSIFTQINKKTIPKKLENVFKSQNFLRKLSFNWSSNPENYSGFEWRRNFVPNQLQFYDFIQFQEFMNLQKNQQFFQERNFSFNDLNWRKNKKNQKQSRFDYKSKLKSNQNSTPKNNTNSELNINEKIPKKIQTIFDPVESKFLPKFKLTNFFSEESTDPNLNIQKSNLQFWGVNTDSKFFNILEEYKPEPNQKLNFSNDLFEKMILELRKKTN